MGFLMINFISDYKLLNSCLNYASTVQLKVDKKLVKDVHFPAKELKIDQVKQVCDYLLSTIDVTSFVS
jgi:hypothetical protein